MNIYDISERAGVSIATVSRVLNNNPHVSQATREKVLAVISDCGYVPNAFARGLGLNTMKTVGLLCPDAADPYLAQALACLEADFRSHGYDCLLACTGKDRDARMAGVAQLSTRHVDGMVLMGSSFIENNDRYNDYIRQAGKKVPVMLLNGAFTAENVSCVLCDDERATREAAEYLLDTGCRRILYLYHSRNDSGRRKLSGYMAALENRGVAADERLLCLFEEDKLSVQHVRDHLAALAREGLAFDAVLASEDSLGVGAVKYAKMSGLRVPDDLSVIGYNNSAFCLCCEPELSSVDNKLKAICAHIVTAMVGVLEGHEAPQRTVFTADLVLRGSTRAR